jgi:hypothetical protein
MLSQKQVILNKNLIKINTEITKILDKDSYVYVLYAFI